MRTDGGLAQSRSGAALLPSQIVADRGADPEPGPVARPSRSVEHGWHHDHRKRAKRHDRESKIQILTRPVDDAVGATDAPMGLVFYKVQLRMSECMSASTLLRTTPRPQRTAPPGVESKQRRRPSLHPSLSHSLLPLAPVALPPFFSHRTVREPSGGMVFRAAPPTPHTPKRTYLSRHNGKYQGTEPPSFACTVHIRLPSSGQ